MLTGESYSSEHLVPSNLELAYVLLVETNPFPELVTFSGLFTSNILRYFLDLAFKNMFKLITRPVVYGDLFYKLMRVKDIANFISLGSPPSNF